MIAPKPFKYVCPTCNYSKIVKPKSDVLNPLEYNNICPKCKKQMKKEELNSIDSLVGIFK